MYKNLSFQVAASLLSLVASAHSIETNAAFDLSSTNTCLSSLSAAARDSFLSTRAKTQIMPHHHKRQALAFASRQHVDGDTIIAMLSRMTAYFHSMVDPNTNRFYYRCLPESKRRIHGHCPVRDLGSAWDTATLLNFWRHIETKPENYSLMSSRLSSAVAATVDAYNGPLWLVFKDSQNRQCVAIPSKLLREPSNIAHSAFLILSSVGALRLSLLNNDYTVPIDELVRGILSMQQVNTGAFAIQFRDDDIYRGIEFYPGEAMLALLDAVELSNDTQGILSPSTHFEIVPAVQRAFLFYSNYYHQGNVDDGYTSFFGNWQVQCFSKLYDILAREESKNAPVTGSVTSFVVAEYILELCDAIIESSPWQLLHRGEYAELSTVEIACGLEAIADGCRIASNLYSESVPLDTNAQERLTRYWQYVESAVRFLATIQNAVPANAVGAGGLGHALSVTEQRLDVTGHAVNALIKVYGVQTMLSSHVSNTSKAFK
jgi:hypothetical protein